MWQSAIMIKSRLRTLYICGKFTFKSSYTYVLTKLMLSLDTSGISYRPAPIATRLFQQDKQNVDIV